MYIHIYFFELILTIKDCFPLSGATNTPWMSFRSGEMETMGRWEVFWGRFFLIQMDEMDQNNAMYAKLMKKQDNTIDLIVFFRSTFFPKDNLNLQP